MCLLKKGKDIVKRIHNTHYLWALLLIVAGQRDMQAAGLDKVKQLSAEESVSADILSLTFGNGEKVSLSKELAQRSGLLANALSGEPDAKSIPINKSFCAGFALDKIVELLTVDNWAIYLNGKDDKELYRLFLLDRYLAMPQLFEALAQKIGTTITREATAAGTPPQSASSKEESKSVLDSSNKVFAQTIAKNIGFIPTTEHTTLQGHTEYVTSVAYSPNGSRIASGSADDTVRIWNVATGEPVGHPLQGHTSLVTSVAYSPNGSRIASGSWDRTVRIWDAATGEPVGAPLQGHAGVVDSVAYSPDGTHIVSGSWDKTVRIWDAATGGLVRTLAGHTDKVFSVAYSPDGTHIVSGTWDNHVRIWNAATGGLVRTLAGHTDNVLSVAYSPDGKQIASGSEDRTVRIWDAATGALLHTLQGHTSLVSSVAYSPDGAQIASGSFDKTVRIWGEPMEQRVVRAEQWIKNVLKKAEAKSSFIKGVQSRYVSPSLADMQAATNLSSGNSTKQQNSRNKPYAFKLKPKPIAFNDSMVAAATKLERRQGLSSEDRTSLKDLQGLVKQTIESRKKADADSSSKESGLADLQEIVTSERILYPAEIDYLRSLDKKITEALNQGSSSLMPSSGPASAGGGGERE